MKSQNQITTKQLVEKLAVKAQIPRETVRHLIGVLPFLLLDLIVQGKTIRLANFGEFRPLYHPGRIWRNQHGAEYLTRPTHRIQFRAFDATKKILLENTNATS